MAARARRDLFALWKRIATSSDAADILRDVLPDLIDTYGAAAATLAADWYDQIRDEAGAPGRFQAIPADVTDSGAQALVGWALEQSADLDTMRTLVEGGTQRRIANYSRLTVSRSSAADPQSVGWKRIGYGSCTFCQMLIQRDVVYSARAARFASHDHCNCQAYPLIKGAEPVDVKKYVQSKQAARQPGESEEAYERRRTVERARVREWIAKNNP